MRRGAETGEEVVLIEHERLERDGRRGGGLPRRHRIPHPKARATARGPVRRDSARLEHGRRC